MSETTLVDVTFIDADTSQTFLKLKLPMRQLPPSFDAQTTLRLGKHDWLVLEATPPSAEAVEAAGALKLVMRKLPSIDLSTVLFSLPTVADVIPEDLEGEPSGALRLHEDDWLQLELVPTEVAAAAQPDLDAIKAVLDDERTGAGFQRLHVRKALPAPWAAKELRLAALEALFGPSHPVAWRSATAALKGCFAFPLPSGAWLYGQAPAGRVVALGLVGRDEQVAAQVGGLTLIDWCAAGVA